MTGRGANGMQLGEAIVVHIRIGDAVETVSWDEWEARVRAGRINATTMVRFEPVTGDAFRPAGELEIYQSMRSEERLAWQSRFAGGVPIVTALLVGVQIRIWWYAQVNPIGAWLVQNGLRENSAIFEDGESWRWVTMGFLHTDLFHIASNTVFLAFAAYNLERTLGRSNLFVLYIASVVGGSALSSVLGPETPSLGASGGVYGLIAAMVSFGFMRPELLPPQSRLFFLLTSTPYMIGMFITGLMSDRVDNAAHFGGLITGLVLGGVLVPDAIARRPGDTGRVRAAVLGVVAMAMLVPAVGGPRLLPLQSAADRSDEVAYVTSLWERWFPSDDRARPKRALAWSVPASWSPSIDLFRDRAFASPVGEGEARTWRVAEREHDALVDLATLAEAWRTEVAEAYPGSQVGEPTPAELGGHDGLRVSADLTNGTRQWHVEWRGATQGVWSLQAVWQVELGRQARLAPLHDRLLARVEWSEPVDLQLAEAEFEAFPTLARTIEGLAHEEIRAGRWESGTQRLWAHLQGRPDAAGRWEKALKSLRPVTSLLPDPDRWYDGALRQAPVPKVIEEVATGLDRLGRHTEAVGLLELAWARTPGDRRLRRMRRRWGLGWQLDPVSGRPWVEAYDPLTGRRRSIPSPDVSDGLSLASAADAGAQYEADRRTLAEQTVAWVTTADARAIVPLLVFRFGAADPSDTDEVETVFGELARAAKGETFAWLPAEVAAAFADEPDRLDVLKSSLGPG